MAQYVYVIIKNNGLEYEDNCEWIDSIFYNEELANNYLKLIQETYKKQECKFRIEKHQIK